MKTVSKIFIGFLLILPIQLFAAGDVFIGNTETFNNVGLRFYLGLDNGQSSKYATPECLAPQPSGTPVAKISASDIPPENNGKTLTIMAYGNCGSNSTGIYNLGTFTYSSNEDITFLCKLHDDTYNGGECTKQ